MTRDQNAFRSPAYGWVIVVLAALAMVGTFPGRTFGLGMITERLLSDSTLHLDRKSFGDMNLWATLIGALFCLPAGWLLDKWGIRTTSTLITGLFGIVIIAMTRATDALQFAILITLTRGLGQSALSVVSISMTGKWFRNRLPLATGVYSFLVSLGFAGAFVWGRSQSELEWRVLWFELGAILLFVLAPIFALFVRSAPNSPQELSAEEDVGIETDFSLVEALATPAFWMFGIATSFYGLVSSGTSLFNESLLTDQGFDKKAYYDLMSMTPFVGFAANLITGWMATQVRINLLASTALGLVAAGLLSFPFVRTFPALVAYAITMGWAGGMITVLFFTIWAKLYGRSQLGRIQGVAQMLTVFASGMGPKVLGDVKVGYGSYLPAIVSLGLIAFALAVSVAFAPVPRRKFERSPVVESISS